MTITDTLEIIDIEEHLAKQRMIAVIWSIEVVQSERPDLRDDQAWEVLRLCSKHHDSEHGITWGVIGEMAETLFPEPDDFAAVSDRES